MSEAVRYIDTTLRDLASPPWGSAIATEDLAQAAAAIAPCAPSLMEAMDSGCAAAALEVRSESPWDRLRAVVREVGSVPVGIVTVGNNGWGHHPLADDVIRRFISGAADCGISRVRAVDPLNNADVLSVTARAAGDAGLRFVPTLILGPAPAPSDGLWVKEALALAALPGAEAICISDKAGHFESSALSALVSAVREQSGLPVELQVQAPGGLAPLLAVAAVEAGAGAVQSSAGSVALVAARPATESLRAALVSSPRALDTPRQAIYKAAREIAPMLPADRLRQAATAVYGSSVGLSPDLEAALVWRLSRYGLSDRLVDAVMETAEICREVGGVTLSHPIADAIVAQAANHVIGGQRWQEIEPALAHVALGNSGRLRCDVDPGVLEAANASDLEPQDAPKDLAAIAAEAAAGISEEDQLLVAQFGDAADGLIRRRQSIGSESLEAPAGVGVDRELIETMVDVVEGSGNSEVTVEIAGARVTVRRTGDSAPAEAAAAARGGAPADDALVAVTSPIVGTFYRASSPEAGPFVSEGSRVEVGDVLCLVEAMKLFNEIVAETAGTVREICMENEQPVEFGQVLFRIEP